MHLRLDMPTPISVRLVAGASVLALATLSACGTQTTSPGPVDARTSIYPARPSGTLIPSDFALGGGPSIRPRSGERDAMSEEELATYMKPEGRAKPARERAPAQPPSPPVPPEPLPALPRLPPVAGTLQPATRTELPSAAPVAPEPAAPDMQRYAEREQRASGLSDFRGGEVVVISITTLVIVLVIVLIVLLVT